MAAGTTHAMGCFAPEVKRGATRAVLLTKLALWMRLWSLEFLAAIRITPLLAINLILVANSNTSAKLSTITSASLTNWVVL